MLGIRAARTLHLDPVLYFLLSYSTQSLFGTIMGDDRVGRSGVMVRANSQKDQPEDKNRGTFRENTRGIPEV